ncbi:MAG: hypothetical protein MO846_02095 [Candidatus Devosia symbiotica]|nr:hypothetical protein [Candidatus Devosia symbiotica]
MLAIAHIAIAIVTLIGSLAGLVQQYQSAQQHKIQQIPGVRFIDIVQPPCLHCDAWHDASSMLALARFTSVMVRPDILVSVIV